MPVPRLVPERPTARSRRATHQVQVRSLAQPLNQELARGPVKERRLRQPSPRISASSLPSAFSATADGQTRAMQNDSVNEQFKKI